MWILWCTGAVLAGHGGGEERGGMRRCNDQVQEAIRGFQSVVTAKCSCAVLCCSIVPRVGLVFILVPFRLFSSLAEWLISIFRAVVPDFLSCSLPFPPLFFLYPDTGYLVVSPYPQKRTTLSPSSSFCLPVFQPRRPSHRISQVPAV